MPMQTFSWIYLFSSSQRAQDIRLFQARLYFGQRKVASHLDNVISTLYQRGLTNVESTSINTRWIKVDFIMSTLFQRRESNIYSICIFRLDLDYVDLYLMHTPSGGKILETYDAMLKLREQGVVK